MFTLIMDADLSCFKVKTNSVIIVFPRKPMKGRELATRAHEQMKKFLHLWASLLMVTAKAAVANNVKGQQQSRAIAHPLAEGMLS